MSFFATHAAVMADRLAVISKKSPIGSAAYRFQPADLVSASLKIASELPPDISDAHLVKYLAAYEARDPAAFALPVTEQAVAHLGQPNSTMSAEGRLALANRLAAQERLKAHR